MDEIELRFEALQRHLQARETSDLGRRSMLQAEGDLLSARADVAMVARVQAMRCNDDSVEGRVA